MKRSQAADLIDELRLLEAANRSIGSETVPLWRVQEMLTKAGLQPLERCDGEAHSNAFIDNCMRCAPRWGYVGTKEPVR